MNITELLQHKSISDVKALIANPCEGVFYDKRYAICNEFGVIALVHANNEQDAIDEAVDNDKMDCQLMSAADHKEYDDNGWNDSFIYAGNASEPFWSEYLGVYEV